MLAKFIPCHSVNVKFDKKSEPVKIHQIIDTVKLLGADNLDENL